MMPVNTQNERKEAPEAQVQVAAPPPLIDRPPAAHHIALRGVSTHNLLDLDVDIPHRSLVVVTGVSGSGKSSLAFDTLYAEGQRRFLESMSTYARQFLQRMEKPPLRSIENVLPAIALRQRGVVVLAVDRQYRMEKFAPTVPQLGEHDHCLDRLTRQALRTVDQEQKCPLMALTLSDRLAEDLDPGGKVLPPGPVLFGNFQASAQQVHKPRRLQLFMARDG